MKENITGMMVYYYFVCKRKLWYFCHEITMETENEDVLLGKLLDESSYKKNDMVQMSTKGEPAGDDLFRKATTAE